VLAVCAWFAFAPAARADVQITVRNGRVTLVAKDATLRQILTEWARVGQMKVVNVEKVPGGPVSLELRDVPEGEALDILLRSLSGYIAAPRTAVMADASVFESISVIPTVAAAAATRGGVAGPAPAPFTPPGAFLPNDDDQNGQPAVVRPPVFAPFPGQQQQPGNPGVLRPVLPVVRPGIVPAQPNINSNEIPSPQVPTTLPFPNTPSASPGNQAPIGVSAPGMIAPATQPGQVPQPQRPPGD
jgi:hypothetical protein